MNSLWIEKFTDEKYSLLEKIGRTEKGLALTDIVMKAAEEDFLVRSFREFLQKFNPCVYMYMDFTNNLVTFSRYREAEIQVPGMGEGKIAQMTECIHLYEENGYYVKVARWINYLHQGKKLALNASERRDWFFDDMIRKDKCFTNQLNSLIRHPKKENMLNSFLQEFDEGIFLLRRFLYRYELYVKKKIRFSLLENESNGQLRPMDFTGRIKIAKRNQREKNQMLSEILEAMKQLPFKHRELLYWNCLLDISDAKLYETREFQTVLERVR